MSNKLKILFLLVAILIIGMAISQKEQLSSSVTAPAENTQETHPENTKPVSVAKTEEMKTPTVAPSKSQEMEAELSEAMEALPTIDDVKKLTEEEVHHTPTIVKDGGLLIGELQEAAENDPSRREETLKFFKGCAENSELLPAIRAVCWKKTLSQIVEWKIFLPVAEADVPEDIQDLAAKLP